MTVVLFEDKHVTQLYPVTVSRPAFLISCASYRLYDLVSGWGHRVCTLVRPHLRAVQQADYPQSAWGDLRPGETAALVNARLVPSAVSARLVKEALSAGQPGMVSGPNGVALAILPPGAALPKADCDVTELHQFLDGLSMPRLEIELPLFDYPHDIVRHHLETLAAKPRTPAGHAVRIAKSPTACSPPTARSWASTSSPTRGAGPSCWKSGPRSVRIVT